jgi:hypothetical protein
LYQKYVQSLNYASGGENSHIEALNFYPIFIPIDECKVSGVSVRVSEDRGQTTACDELSRVEDRW